MGLIIDGKVSGKLPEQVAFAVNYPGYPSSVQRAIETLGGEEGLAKARSSESNFLELKFRPEDPYAHPAFGELTHSSALVLRLSRKANRRSPEGCDEERVNSATAGSQKPEDSQASERTEDVRAEVVAKVDHTYSFEGMTDYQYVVAIHADENRAHKRKGHQLEKGSLLDMEQGELMMLIPPLFSVKDLPEDIFLRPPGGKRPKQGFVETEVNPEVVVPFALDFKIKEVPSTTTWKQQLNKNSDAYAWTEALVNMFEERPVWTKNTLNDRLMEQEVFISDGYLRSLLFRIAYYFGCGPFRNLWIKNGYDPRKDPQSRKCYGKAKCFLTIERELDSTDISYFMNSSLLIWDYFPCIDHLGYQAIDFRVPAMLRGKSDVPKTPPSWKDLCSFKAVPQKKFTVFQMYDLHDDTIQAEINKPPERTTCGESTGWYRLSTIQRMRLVVRIRFLALYPGEVARTLENAEHKNLNRRRSIAETEEEHMDSCLRLELTDRTSLNASDPNGNPSLQQLQPKSCATGDHVDDTGEDETSGKLIEEDEEDEDEEDEEDEELEDDEDEEVEDVDVPSENDIAKLNASMPTAYMDPADNIPKSYLQALLGKFSFEGDGAEHTGNGSFAAREDDEEYTIYGQDEDDEDD